MPVSKRGRTISRGASATSSRGASRRSMSVSRSRSRSKARPVRFRQGSAKVAKAGRKQVNSLVKVGVLEKKQSVGTDYNEVSLAKRCSDNIQYVSFIATDSSIGTETSNPLDLFTLSRGSAQNQYQGRYINVQKLHMRYCIQVPPIEEKHTDSSNSFKGMGTRKLRCMLVCPKMTSAPAGTTLSTDTSLFLDYAGGEYGLANATDKPAWELMSAPINQKNWVKQFDRTYTVSPDRIDTLWGGTASTQQPKFVFDNGSGKYSFSYDEAHAFKHSGATQMMLNFSIPIFKKVSYDSVTGRPDDLNAAYRLIVISEMPGMTQADQKATNAATYGTNRVRVSCRSFIQYVDA